MSNTRKIKVRTASTAIIAEYLQKTVLGVSLRVVAPTGQYDPFGMAVFPAREAELMLTSGGAKPRQKVRIRSPRPPLRIPRLGGILA